MSALGAEFTDPLEALGHLDWEGDPSSGRRCEACGLLAEEHYSEIPERLVTAVAALLRQSVLHLEGPDGEATTLSLRAEAFAGALEERGGVPHEGPADW